MNGKPSKLMYAGWAIRAGNRWLASHGFTETCDWETVDKTTAAGWKHRSTRPPNWCAAAWFGSAAIRRALCEVGTNLYSPADLIVSALRKPRVASPAGLYEHLSDVEWRIMVARDAALVWRKLVANEMSQLSVHGRWHSGPSDGRTAINIHQSRRPDPDYDLYCAEFQALADVLRRVGFQVTDHRSGLEVFLPPALIIRFKQRAEQRRIEDARRAGELYVYVGPTDRHGSGYWRVTRGTAIPLSGSLRLDCEVTTGRYCNCRQIDRDWLQRA